MLVLVLYDTSLVTRKCKMDVWKIVSRLSAYHFRTLLPYSRQHSHNQTRPPNYCTCRRSGTVPKDTRWCLNKHTICIVDIFVISICRPFNKNEIKHGTKNLLCTLSNCKSSTARILFDHYKVVWLFCYYNYVLIHTILTERAVVTSGTLTRETVQLAFYTNAAILTRYGRTFVDI